jgi:hypothetical protein
MRGFRNLSTAGNHTTIPGAAYSEAPPVAGGGTCHLGQESTPFDHTNLAPFHTKVASFLDDGPARRNMSADVEVS